MLMTKVHNNCNMQMQIPMFCYKCSPTQLACMPYHDQVHCGCSICASYALHTHMQKTICLHLHQSMPLMPMLTRNVQKLHTMTGCCYCTLLCC